MISLIIPAYNEKKRIKNTLLNYWRALKSLNLEFEIIVEMDGCIDGTQYIVKELSKNVPELKYVEFEERLGKGGGIKEGFKVSRGDVVGFVDADGSVPPEEFLKLIKFLERGYDVVIASRRAEGAIVRNQPLKRKILSKCFNLYVRFMFNIPYRDTQCGAKVFKRYVLEEILNQVNSNGFAFDVNVLYLAHRAGYAIKEVGVMWEDRYGSKVNIPKAVLEMGLDILKLRLYYSPMKYFFWRNYRENSNS